MKRLFPFLFSACCAFGAAGDYTLIDETTVVIEDSRGNKIVAGRVEDHAKICKPKLQTASDTYLNAKFSEDKKKAVKDAKVLKDHGLTVPSNIKDDTESWIETDSNDPEKAKELKAAAIIPAAEGIGCTISAESKKKIDDSDKPAE